MNEMTTDKIMTDARFVMELESSDKGKFRLTTNQILLFGDRESATVYSSLDLKDITCIQIFRRSRTRRSAIWGLIGLFSAIGLWQTIPSSTSGLIAGMAVAAISLILIADYWVRPTGVRLDFQSTHGKSVGGNVTVKTENAVEFVRIVEDTKRKLLPSRLDTPYRNYPSG
ncbi:MAG: hypothetical protein CL791_04505 [Chloroflexi bacterium]|nr:hypothetical protein [Chloroflexota bacterium]|tara:strand:- start:1027 stop:1536 length:510 start_codon:yes stop_codon:yes gene_type:complete